MKLVAGMFTQIINTVSFASIHVRLQQQQKNPEK